MKKQFYYSIQYLRRGKSNLSIKILSLTLGLAVAFLLFSKVAYEISYDTFYPDVDQLYQLERKASLHGEQVMDGPQIPGAIAPGIRDEIAGVESSQLLIANTLVSDIKYGETIFREKILLADTGFFDFFGINLLEGDKELLGVEGNIFLSRSMAQRLFGNTPAVGERVVMGNNRTIPVAGIYEDIPDNSHLEADILLSLETNFKSEEVKSDWVLWDRYWGYLKLEKGVSPRHIEAQLPALIDRHTAESEFAYIGIEAVYSLIPVKNIHSGDASVKKMILILSILGFSLLIVASLNYVLISISSLVKRAKAIGVHKCNGASSGNIFTQFVNETSLLVLISFILSILLILLLQHPIQTILDLQLSTLFSIRNLYVILTVMAAILLTAAIIPGWLFSSIPVTQVFRAYTTANRHWKQLLLFVQFGGIAFIVSLLWIIVKQYDMILHKDMGYTVENVIYSGDIKNIPPDQLKLIKREFERMPQVISTTFTDFLPIQGADGEPILDPVTQEIIFSSRKVYADRDFFDTFKIELLHGNTFPEGSDRWNVVVNQEFVEQMHLTESPIGQTFKIEEQDVHIVGVSRNYQLMTYHARRSALFQGISPLMINPVDFDKFVDRHYKMVMRLHKLDMATMAELNMKLKELVNNEEAQFRPYQNLIEDSYSEAHLFRSSLLVAAIVMLIIAILGIIGYVQDEINRRTKEIGIRKINGATVKDILITLARDIVYISIPSIVIGIAVSYVIGQQWLTQFAEKIPLTILLFLTSGSFVLTVIITCVVLRSWEVANENPVKSIKTE